MHPTNSKILYSAMANGQPRQWERPTGAESVIARTKDGGKSWEELDGDGNELSSNFAVDIVIDQDDPNQLYAALTNGVIYYSENSGDSWKSLGLKIPNITL